MRNQTLLVFSKIAISVATTLAGYHLVTRYFHLNFVNGLSMQPSLMPSDTVLSRKIQPNKVKHGDIVVLYSPTEHNKLLVKRIIGLPGDQIMPRQDSRFWQHHHNKEYLRVPSGHMWVEGDNSSTSLDSNDYGMIPMALIQSKVLLIEREFSFLLPNHTFTNGRLLLNQKRI